MSGIATAIIGAAVVGAGVGIYASGEASSAQESAAETAAAATTTASQKATDTQLKMFEMGREDTAPWRKAGEEGLNMLLAKIKAGPGDYTSSPGYAFRVGEGQKAIERSAAARGGLFSGRTGKELTRFSEDYATGDYQNWLANYYASLTPYQSLAGVGQTTAQQNAVIGNQVGANIGQNTMQAGQAAGQAAMAAGQAQGAGYINQANAITGGANTGISNYLMWKYINRTPTPALPASSAGWYDQPAYEWAP